MPGWDDVFGFCPQHVRAVALALRETILRLHPETVETARPGDRAVTFGTGPRKLRDGYLYLMPQAGRVNLGFHRGTDLADPARLLDGTGKALRHVKVTSAQVSPEIAALISAALALHRHR